MALIVDAVADFVEQYPTPVWLAAHAWALAETGRVDEARRIVAEHGLDPVALVAEPFPFIAPFHLAWVARLTGDVALAARCIEALEPHRDRWAHYFLVVLGPVTWPLGWARCTAGDLDGGIAELEEAIATMERSEMPAHLNLARTDLADALEQRGEEGDVERAAALVVEVRAGAIAVGATGVLEALDRRTDRSG